MKTYSFFWGGEYSNFHPCSFKDAAYSFNCNEQYFMFGKALLFNDNEVAKKILEASDPVVIKKLGREVKGFEATQWDLAKENIMYSGLKLKFTQNPELKKLLLAEKADLFVETSPYDLIWGIGLDERNAKETPEDMWPGQNLLGQLLTKLREELRNE